MVDAVDDGLVEDHVAGRKPLRHLGGELRSLVEVMPHGEAGQRQCAGDDVGHVVRAGDPLGGVVADDRPAERRTPAVVECVEGCLEVVAADVVEVDVDAVGSGCAQLLADRALFVVDRGVESVTAGEQLDLLVTSRRADDGLGAEESCDLARGGPHGTGGAGDEHDVARLHLRDLGQADIGGQARHAEHAEVERRVECLVAVGV